MTIRRSLRREVSAWVWGAMVVGVVTTPATWAAKWETDFERALAEARATGRYVLVDFSGSDWCGWCVKLDREVFQKPAFERFARRHLVLFLADFPRGKAQNEDLRQQNERLARRFGVRGFPTVILLSPTGEEAGRTGYRPGGAQAYVDHLRAIISDHKAARR